MRISDWSSDVCASDLSSGSTSSLTKASAQSSFAWYSGSVSKSHMRTPSVRQNGVRLDAAPAPLEDAGGGYRVAMPLSTRPAERQVGTDCVGTGGTRWSPVHSKQKIELHPPTNR